MTPTEFVLVAGVTLILAAVLFPSLSGLREYGRRASCKGNLKRLALGMAQYSQDYDKRFVSWRSDTTGWAELLYPYVKSVQTLQCPSEPNPAGPPSFDVPGYNDYVYNLQMGLARGAYIYSGGVTQSQLTQPALTVMLIDWNSASPEQWTEGCAGDGFLTADKVKERGGCRAPGLADFSSGFFNGQGSALRHLGGQNAAFADGHVKWCSGSTGYQSASIYNVVTPRSMSAGSPTFNIAP
jgi:prepilin-type processing-associated H-X9-DG protein